MLSSVPSIIFEIAVFLKELIIISLEITLGSYQDEITHSIKSSATGFLFPPNLITNSMYFFLILSLKGLFIGKSKGRRYLVAPGGIRT